MRSKSQASIDGVQLIGPAQITALFRAADLSPRKRAHLLLHPDHADQVQRLLIACRVGTYIRPHYHPEQWELMSLLEGNADVITFKPNGCPLDRHSMRHAPVVQIGQSAVHTVIITAPRTLLLEVKPGPFRPSEFPSWAPEENSEEALDLLKHLNESHVG